MTEEISELWLLRDEYVRKLQELNDEYAGKSLEGYTEKADELDAIIRGIGLSIVRLNSMLK